MGVKIGHASISEKGTVNGKVGDQTKKEVVTRTWYSKPWVAVYRPKDTKVAEKIAHAMEQACANDRIGYGQNDRTTLFDAAKSVGFDISKVKKLVNTDCSALVAVCCNAAGIKVSKDMYTGNEGVTLMATKKFDKLEGSLYTQTDGYLKRGDILLAKGHTAVCLEDGALNKKATVKKSTTKKTSTTTKSTKKSVEAIAKEVLDGKWGDNPTRKAKLEKAGYDYSVIQKKVNELAKKSK